MARTGGAAAPVRAFNLRISAPLYEYMRRHAFERGVGMNQLISDILRLWVTAATDPSDPLFSKGVMGVPMPEPPGEEYPGYLEGLVFVLPKE